jgi:acyl carrier protein
LDPASVRRFHGSCNAELHNLYGPTEASVHVTHWTCGPERDSQAVLIGRPVANTRIHVLDKRLDTAPIGVDGELCIGGEVLARGYLNQPALTAERFIPDALSGIAGQRLYKSGDLARYMADGEIQCLGRIDYQVKIRGYRIELGEIESVLNEHPGIADAVVEARASASGDKRLVAYLVSRVAPPPAVTQLRSHLAQRVPEFMSPSAFVWLESLPVNSSGKLDRRALPDPDGTSALSGREYAAPRDPIEEMLAEIWSNALGIGVERIGIHDNFFELGGHSLLLIEMAMEIKKIFAVEMPLRVLFTAVTISDLAAAICEEQIRIADPIDLAHVLDEIKHVSIG